MSEDWVKVVLRKGNGPALKQFWLVTWGDKVVDWICKGEADKVDRVLNVCKNGDDVWMDLQVEKDDLLFGEKPVEGEMRKKIQGSRFFNTEC